MLAVLAVVGGLTAYKIARTPKTYEQEEVFKANPHDEFTAIYENPQDPSLTYVQGMVNRVHAVRGTTEDHTKVHTFSNTLVTSNVGALYI